MSKVKTSVLALSAIYDVRQSQRQIYEEQKALLAKNKKNYELDKWGDVSSDQLIKGIRSSIENDLESIKAANEKVQIYKNNKGVVHFGISSNKMSEILTGVKGLFETDEGGNILRIARGELPSGYDNTVREGVLPQLGKGEFWGSSQSTFLTAAASIVNMYLTDTGKLPLNIGGSYSTYAVPYPQDLNLGAESRYVYNIDGHAHLAFFHSGYLFGGNRFGPDVVGKPQDCSSFLEKLTNVQTLYPGATATTADLVCVYRHHTHSSDFIPGEWYNTQSSSLTNLYSSVTGQQTPGNIWVKRGFKEDPEKNLGINGHTAIVIDAGLDGTVSTVGVSRNMPDIEGYGMQDFPSSSSNPNELMFFLQPTDKALEGKGRFSEIEYNGATDLVAVLNHFDEEFNKLLSGVTIEYL